MMNNTVSIKNLNKVFKDKQIFINANMDFESDKINLIVGRNGVGKTTLIRMISGDIETYTGEIINSSNDIFFMPNIPDIFSDETVEGFLRFIQSSYALSIMSETVKKSIEDILQKKIKCLSTGEKQKVILVAALISRAKVILLDEPTNGIDEKFKGCVDDYFLEMLCYKSCVIVSTHLISDFKNIPVKNILIEDKKIKKLDGESSRRINLKITKENLSFVFELFKKQKINIVETIINTSDVLIIGEYLELINDPQKILKEILDNGIKIISFNCE